jgi:hypothetical protein
MAAKEQKNPDADPKNITTADKSVVDLAAATVKKQNEDSLQEAKERDASNDKDSAKQSSGDSEAPTGANRHWTAEGMDAVTFDDEPPV